ncbi:hypothetical protein [Alkanindiges illinoisensis]|uniref:hypothetical protein n=1 Tax=Alkanindiges illinoisensis TaxID=197183 RepID=UPI00047E183B|nr:hypothetical protein [Alkanindiges illinoisensis]
MSHLRLRVKSGFRLSALALSIGLSLMSSRGFALEALDDDSLADSTGEGIAFLPENASIRLNGADTNNSGAGTYDTGYIRLIPVGPLTATAAASGAGKADVFMYGLAISQSNKAYNAARDSTDTNSRFSRTIDSWGSAINPWLLKVTTDSGIPNFSTTDSGTYSVSYLNLEAPLYHANIAGLSDAEKSAYNLKLGFWADAFVRDPSVVENMSATGTQFNLGGAGRANRLRLQAIWDGLSINGSNIKMFQTLGGATNTGGMSTFYNNTLGLSGLLRFNSNDAGVLRLSTQETATSSNSGLLDTPAINGGVAPTFNDKEGIYIYKPNINLVLGSLYQPLVLGTDGQNITLEIARIPNKASIYNQIYTNYANPADTTYLGSTCSQFYCGSKVDGVANATYQGNNATHSSITMGDVVYNNTSRTITASTAADAKGITFSNGTGTTTNLGSAVIDGLLIQHLKFTTKGL